MEDIVMQLDSEVMDIDYTDFYEDRKLFFNKEVTAEFAQEILSWLMRWEKEDVGVPIEDRQPIIMYINSNGGEVASGLTLIDFIQLMRTPVYMVILSRAYSMSALLLLSTPVERRYMFRNSAILFHDGYFAIEGKASSTKDHIRFNDKQELVCERLVLENTNITKRQYRKNIITEWFMDTKEAKKLGVVGKIIGEDISLEDIL